MHLSGVKINTDPQMAFISNDVYLYANVKGSTIPQPIEILPKKESYRSHQHKTFHKQNKHCETTILFTKTSKGSHKLKKDYGIMID